MKTDYGNANLNSWGYLRITSRKEGNHSKYLHNLIWENHYNKPVPEGYVIHHLDGDKLNNNINNLQCVKIENHNRFHNKLKNFRQYGYVKPDLSTKILMSKNQNTSGYFRVIIRNRNGINYYEYTYYDEDGKRRSITRKTIEILKQEVLKRELEWIEFNAS